MGWGCYRHEVDIDSLNAQRALGVLVLWEQGRGFPAWGRDEKICPFCYAELLHFARLAFHQLRALDEATGNLERTELLAFGESLFEHERHSLPLMDDCYEAVMKILDDGGTDDEVEAVNLAG